MNPNSDSRSGTIIPAVLLVAFVVLLIGFGRLADHFHRTTIRLDRQREIQQSLATRSVLHWLETLEQNELPVDEVSFPFSTKQGLVRAVLRPAPPLFPAPGNDRHYDVRKHGSWGSFSSYVFNNSDHVPKIGTNIVDSISGEIWKGLVFGDMETFSTGEDEWCRIEIDLAADSGARVDAFWPDSEYGLRYFVQLTDFCKNEPGVTSGDRMRFGITPKGETLTRLEGGGKAPYAIWMDQVSGEDCLKTEVDAFLYARTPERPDGCLLSGGRWKTPTHIKGIQVAGTHATLFEKTGILYGSGKMPNVSFLETVDLDRTDLGSGGEASGFIEGFKQRCREKGGVRLTLEFQLLRPRPSDPHATDEYRNSVVRIAVAPSYEYELELEWKNRGGETVREVSSVICCSLSTERYLTKTWTYDTHGTFAKRRWQKKDN